MGLELNDIILPLLLTVFAGLSTVLGWLIVFVGGKDNRSNTKLLAYGLGIAAGVMIFISLGSISTQSAELIGETQNTKTAQLLVLCAIGVGALVSGIIDRIIPHFFHLHSGEDESIINHKDQESLYQSATFSTIALALHNLPEGLITFMAAIVDIRLGIALAVAITLHNIPEGISIALPVYQATGSKIKAFQMTAFAAFAEPIGAIIAIIAFFIFGSVISPFWLGISFASVAGIMLYISFDEILPTAFRIDKGHITLYGILSGMLVIALSGILI